MLADFVVQTHHNQERRAHDEIGALGYLVTFLTVREEHRTAHGRTIKIVPLFHCYIFVLLDLANHKWEEITNCRGVKNLLGSDPLSPQPLKHGTLWEIKNRFQAEEIKPIIVEPAPVAFKAAPIAVDQKVIVDAGSSKPITGICTMSNKDRVRILMEYLGAQREVEMSASRVKPFISEVAA